MTTRRLLAAPALAAALLLAGCTGTQQAADEAPTSPGTTPEPTTATTEQEVADLAPRALITRPGGVTLLDTATGETVAETELEGFVRLNAAGDGRHALITDAAGFGVYDAGIRTEAHGDHNHHYETPAGPTDISYPAEHGGHVVVHERLTALFADGTGEIQVVESGRIADPAAPVHTHATPAAHHGVALQLSDDSLLTSLGTEEERTGARVVRGKKVVASTRACPGVHGEATARPTRLGDVVVLGCEDGPVVYRDGAFHKVAVADAYARTGTLAGHPASPVVLGDYKTDPDAELERTSRISLIDTRTDTSRVVDLRSPYWFRSLARGPHGEALALTYDGTLRVVDPTTGKQTARIEVIEPWREKADWQQPGPIVQVAGEHAYVTDAARAELVVVDLHTHEVLRRLDLPGPAGELVVLTGVPAWEETHAH